MATVLSVTEAEEELAKFLALSVELKAGLTMFSEFVDQAWHDLLDDPAGYEAFSKGACGQTLGHVPSGDSNPIVVVEWITEYESRHGDLSAAWFANAAGVLQEDAYSDYLDSHTVVAAWKCAPSSGSVALVTAIDE